MDKINTEQKILLKAIQLFSEKSFSEISTQNLADASGTNKALIHYYYRSKQNLFEKSFAFIIQDFLKAMIPVFEKNEDFLDKISRLIDSLLDYKKKHPLYINMMARELKRNPSLVNLFNDNLPVTFKKGVLNFYRRINEAIETRKIRQVHPRDLLEMIITLCFSDILMGNFYDGMFGKTARQLPNETIKSTLIQLLN